MAVVVTLSATALLGATALAVDIGSLARRRQVVQNALDFGALAGAARLPATGSAAGAAATDDAIRFVARNAPDLDRGKVEVTFACVALDTDGDGLPDPGQVPGSCGPATGTWTDGWEGHDGQVHHACDPATGATCNVIDVTATDSVALTFARILGHDTGSTGRLRASACGGSCPGGGTPLDVVVLLDRTGSMSRWDLANAKRAVLALLETYRAPRDRAALATIPYPVPGDLCAAEYVATYPQPGRSWFVVPLADDYQTSTGVLRTSSALVSSVSCLDFAPSIPSLTQAQTDVGDPLTEAVAMLDASARPGARRAVIVLTDGAANQPLRSQPCAYAVDRARAAEQRGVEVFTVAYGAGDATCNADGSGAFAGKPATTFLAAVATDSDDNAPRWCPASENTDGDHYYCQAAGRELAPVFRQIAVAGASGAPKLVDLS